MSEKLSITVIEPHHDDALGSASGIILGHNANVSLYTLSISHDRRDDADLTGIHASKQAAPGESAVIQHTKYNLEDYHYKYCYEFSHNEDISYDKLAEYYRDGDPSEGKIAAAIDEIIKRAAKESDLIFIPLGLMHPMHVVTTYYAAQSAIRENVLNRIVFYVDHPYDLHVDIDRMTGAVDFYEKLADSRLHYLRMDDCSIDQSKIGSLIKQYYGDLHYGEFDGVLEKTRCSYFVPDSLSKDITDKLQLHTNRILYATIQAKPFTKAGGLSEVAQTYAKALRRHVNDIAIIMPKYDDAEEAIGCKGSLQATFPITLAGKTKECRIEKYLYENIVYYLVDIDEYFANSGSCDISDAPEELSAFALAVLQSAKGHLDFVPSLIHCNEYHTGLIPFLLKMRFRADLPDLKTLFTIHCFTFRGLFSGTKMLDILGLPKDCITPSMRAYSAEEYQKLGIQSDNVSLLHIGIIYADFVNTVSQGYADSLFSHPVFANVSKLYGIRNGISEMKLPLPYGEKVYQSYADLQPGSNTYPKELAARKAYNKALLQEELGLPQEPDTPLLCIVSRLTVQKGIENIRIIFDLLMRMDLQLVIVGNDSQYGSYVSANITFPQGQQSGFRPYEQFFDMMATLHRDKFRYLTYNESNEFKAYAASDMILMPSLEEACSLTQMYAMKHGALPILNDLPAFHDSVISHTKVYPDSEHPGYVCKESRDKGIGFYAFRDDCHTFLAVIRHATCIFREQKALWQCYVNSTQPADFSWDNGSMIQYLNLYDQK